MKQAFNAEGDIVAHPELLFFITKGEKEDLIA